MHLGKTFGGNAVIVTKLVTEQLQEDGVCSGSLFEGMQPIVGGRHGGRSGV